MKIPKLKYWYMAMAEGNYRDFEQSREITVSKSASIDITTGRVTAQTVLYVSESVALADDHYRWRYKTREDLYVLRIPRECIDKSALVGTDHTRVWEYHASLRVPHCGVELVSFNKS